jgi:hypothetical protein
MQENISSKSAVFWDMAPCSPYMNHFGGTYRLHLQGRKSAYHEYVGDSSSKMSVHVRITRRYMPEDGNFHPYCRLKSYNYFVLHLSALISIFNAISLVFKTVYLHGVKQCVNSSQKTMYRWQLTYLCTMFHTIRQEAYVAREKKHGILAS